MRKKIVAGNWKMNMIPSKSIELVTEIHRELNRLGSRDAEIIICPPYTSLERVAKIIREMRGVYCGAQNCHQELSGAYTGEIAAPMLRELGIRYVILGHSERRQYFGETEEAIQQKVKTVLETGLNPIYCCGETLEEREAEEHFSVVEGQIKKALFELEEEQFRQVVIAYEPVWAIGTGKTATPEQAQEIHAYIRSLVANRYGEAVADKTSILYGGSCKPNNAASLFSQPDIDGGLIGGASLNADQFVQIIAAL